MSQTFRERNYCSKQQSQLFCKISGEKKKKLLISKATELHKPSLVNLLLLLPREAVPKSGCSGMRKKWPHSCVQWFQAQPV